MVDSLGVKSPLALVKVDEELDPTGQITSPKLQEKKQTTRSDNLDSSSLRQHRRRKHRSGDSYDSNSSGTQSNAISMSIVNNLQEQIDVLKEKQTLFYPMMDNFTA